ncbi:inverse autotransporter beta domain-containing protein [Enterobacter sp. Bisph1]|uniref:inverse autotransporter beta domain-containing protein n=1 Tax=Enterobacter sp. Bisph1 TaxID=1274399 RepID=UPI00057C16D4|nr:inverse autotransporter beta domain-containing protein [Enterobacter sp. Bisph1]
MIIYKSLFAALMSCALCHTAFAANAIINSQDETQLAQPAKKVSSGGSAALTDMAAGYLVTEITPWLNQFGTVQIEAAIDSQYELNYGAFDMLIPFYNVSEKVIFTQFGVRQQNERITGNVGFGQRKTLNNVLIGYNVFYDHEFTTRHFRLGAGVEMWSEYLKLSANGYYGLAEWKISADNPGYDERPANGFDVRAAGYFPSLPHLGVNLSYENYSAEEGIFMIGQSKKRTFSVFTAGLNFTPFPLLTIGADYRAGQNDLSEALVYARITYRLGVPLSKQLSIFQVTNMHALPVTRLDLVNRNNTIIKSHRSFDSVMIWMPSEIEGEIGTETIVPVSISSHYSIDRLIWGDKAFIAAGGKIRNLGSQRYAFTLPKKVGSWVISLQAIDSQGNLSNKASIKVVTTEEEEPDKPAIARFIAR